MPGVADALLDDDVLAFGAHRAVGSVEADRVVAVIVGEVARFGDRHVGTKSPPCPGGPADHPKAGRARLRTIGHVDIVFGKVRDDGGWVALVDSGDPAPVKRDEGWIAGGRGSTGRKNRKRPSNRLLS